MRKWWIVLVVAAVFTACGGGDDRATAIADLQSEVGMTESQAICAVDALEDEFGSLSFVNNPDDLSDDDAFRAGEVLLGCMNVTSNATEAESESSFSSAIYEEGVDGLMSSAGVTRAEAECAVDAVESEFGSLAFLADADSMTDEQASRAAELVLECAPSLSGDVDIEMADTDRAGAATPGDASGTDTALETEPVSNDGSIQGYWTVAQLCTLLDPGAVSEVFGVSSPADIFEQYEDSELVVCAWNDPFDPSLAPRGMITVRQEAATDFTQFEEPVDVPGAEQVDYRPEFLEGRDFLVVQANDQQITFDWRSETPAALELVRQAATNWVASQNGEAAPQTVVVTTGLNPDTPDPGEIGALTRYWVSCGNGDPDACDFLYLNGPEDTVYYEFGESCGGRESVNCQELLGDERGSLKPDFSPPGDDDALDALWADCGGGSASACDTLYLESPSRSDYEWFGFTCGGRGAFIDCGEAITKYGS